jgi:hypothetical protein
MRPLACGRAPAASGSARERPTRARHLRRPPRDAQKNGRSAAPGGEGADRPAAGKLSPKPAYRTPILWSFVSLMKIEPMTKVIAATTIGYQSP